MMRFIFILNIALLLGSCSKQPISNDLSQEKENPLGCLLEGNKRFVNHHTVHPHQSASRIRELKKGQHPFAVVVCCSDSRVPPELIFDQGLGDIFVIRTAGNIIGDYELGSIEYAVEHLKTRLIMVLGHENCGAVSAFLQHKNDTLHNHIQYIVDYIKNEKEEAEIDPNSPNCLEKAVKANVLHGVHVLEESEPVLHELVKKKELQIVGAVYDMDTGKVGLLK